jgi:hypothetical protein
VLLRLILRGNAPSYFGPVRALVMASVTAQELARNRNWECAKR